MSLEESPALNVTESDNVAVTVRLAAVAQRNIVVNVATMNGSAVCKYTPVPPPPLTSPLSPLSPSPLLPSPSLLSSSAPGDFTAVDMDVTFMAGMTNVTVMVPIVDDMALEEAEQFSIVVTTMDPDVDVVNGMVTVTIVPDGDSKEDLDP